jgi:hypothetical protein
MLGRRAGLKPAPTRTSYRSRRVRVLPIKYSINHVHFLEGKLNPGWHPAWVEQMKPSDFLDFIDLRRKARK